jgi:hypothetical protein
MALELGQTAKHRQHQSPVRRCCIAPRIAKRLEGCASLSDCIEGIEQVPGATRKAIKFSDDQGVAIS